MEPARRLTLNQVNPIELMGEELAVKELFGKLFKGNIFKIL
jgi:hypothetical protein